MFLDKLLQKIFTHYTNDKPFKSIIVYNLNKTVFGEYASAQITTKRREPGSNEVNSHNNAVNGIKPFLVQPDDSLYRN